MVMLRPARGGFLRPFGCGWFIREFLLGNGPMGSPQIDPDKGACQEDIFYHYKTALHREYAKDAVNRENEERILAGKEPYSELEYEERLQWYLDRTPYKLVKARYHSFSRYFHMLKQLGWVEPTGEIEKSGLQDYYKEAPPRKMYKLTEKGKQASSVEWSNPKLVLYPELSLEYHREKRRSRKYIRR